MTEATTLNLNAHYTANPKVQTPKRIVSNVPVNLPNMHLYNDIDANKRMNSINMDIYQGTKREKSRKDLLFWKIFGGIVLSVLAFKGVQKLIHFFK